MYKIDTLYFREQPIGHMGQSYQTCLLEIQE